jgi:hypothetical protein
MKTASGLALIALGAILTFAVTANTSVFNIHVAGVVIMLTGLTGLVIRRKGYGWLRKRLIIPPRARVRRGGRAGTVVEETRYPPYVVRNPGTARARAGLPESQFIEPDPDRVERTSRPEPGDAASGGQQDAEEIVEEFYDQ